MKSCTERPDLPISVIAGILFTKVLNSQALFVLVVRCQGIEIMIGNGQRIIIQRQGGQNIIARSVTLAAKWCLI